MESPQGDPTTHGVRLPEQIGRTERGRKTGKTGRQGGQPDTLSRAGSFRPCLPRLPCPPAMPAYPAPFPAFPACVILSTGVPHAHPAKLPFVKPFYYFPIYQNVTH